MKTNKAQIRRHAEEILSLILEADPSIPSNQANRLVCDATSAIRCLYDIAECSETARPFLVLSVMCPQTVKGVTLSFTEDGVTDVDRVSLMASCLSGAGDRAGTLASACATTARPWRCLSQTAFRLAFGPLVQRWRRRG